VGLLDFSIDPMLAAEMGTKNLPGGKGQLMYKADNFTATCEPIA
jgi:hypothetical protein